MEGKDYQLLVIAAAKSKPLTPVQMQKSLFILGQNLPAVPESYYKFVPYHYGPFDSSIYVDADSLRNEGLVNRSPSRVGDWVETSITTEGEARAAQLKFNLSTSSVKYIEDLVGWVQAQSFSGLLKVIYEQYPEYRANSVFQG